MKENGGARWRLTKEEEQEIRDLKAVFHKNPELSFKEYATTKRIQDKIEEINRKNGSKVIEILTLLSPMETGIIAKLTGEKPGKSIAFRSDMDAILQEEELSHEVRSTVSGVMHACGHDFHMASLLGTMMVLGRNVDEVFGTIYFIFQPAEENTKGAQAMIDHGLFDMIKPDLIFASHNRPEISAGQVVVHKGGLMAAKNNFRILLEGEGGHGSMPHKCVDPIVCAAAIIQTLQTVVSRNTDPLQAVVLTIGSIHGGTEDNLVVDKVTLTGSMRALSEEVRRRALKRIKDIVENMAAAYECKAEFIIEQLLPACENKKEMFEIAKSAAKATVGEENVVDCKPALASEDFSLMMEKVPGFLFWVGSGGDGECYSWHNAKFKTNDDGIRTGAELFVQTVFAANRKNMFAANGKK
ncbi:MAG: M20 family metallopeptidase [Lachnospiraceae bacterium]|nr:M20 family metallopeptidase [Lachnospiraceae bacterium]